MTAKKGTQEKAVKPPVQLFFAGGGGGNIGGNVFSLYGDNPNQRHIKATAINTDGGALDLMSSTITKILIGKETLEGHGTGMKPALGADAMREELDKINLDGTKVGITIASYGGGTGTGIAPIIGKKCRECGVLSILIVTKPFGFEGYERNKLAEEALEEELCLFDKNPDMANFDMIIVVPNDMLLSKENKRTTLKETFAIANDHIKKLVEGIISILVDIGYINIDIADLKTIGKNGGKTIAGYGKIFAGEEDATRAEKLLEGAVDGNPLCIFPEGKRAKRAIINLRSSGSIMKDELDKISVAISKHMVPAEGKLIILGHTDDFGGTEKPEEEGSPWIDVTFILTDFVTVEDMGDTIEPQGNKGSLDGSSEDHDPDF